MSPGVRVYVTTTPRRLAEVMASGGIGPAPFFAHAVTDRLRAELSNGEEEDWEYAAMSAAAQASIGLLSGGDVPRRVVIALDAAGVMPVVGAEPSLVEVRDVVKTTTITAVHVDSEDAEDDVRAAGMAWPGAEAGDVIAGDIVERCLDHELGWYAVQEIADLLDTLVNS